MSACLNKLLLKSQLNNIPNKVDAECWLLSEKLYIVVSKVMNCSTGVENKDVKNGDGSGFLSNNNNKPVFNHIRILVSISSQCVSGILFPRVQMMHRCI